MRKTAVFVEGQTELIFVREFLLKHFEYQGVAFNCYTLFTDAELRPIEYSLELPNANHYFQIINVGMDGNVMPRMMRREKSLWKSGFERIVCLRDMYSKSYREVATKRLIDEDTNRTFQADALSHIKRNAESPDRIHFRFAIMETEAWFLGLTPVLSKIDPSLSLDWIRDSIGVDLGQDPEVTIFHPAVTLDQVLGLAGSGYDKSKGEINALMSYVEKSDFIYLYNSGKCASFKAFHDSLLGL